MNFIISGDTHGALNLAKIVRFFDEHEGEYNEDDCIITHTAPREVCAAINFGELTDEEIEVCRYFQHITL